MARGVHFQIAMGIRKANARRPAPQREEQIVIRALERRDITAVIALDAGVMGEAKPEYWRRKLGRLQAQGLVAPEPGQRGPAAVSSAELARLAEIDGNPVGFALGEIRSWEFRQPPTGWITALEVAAEYRNRGVGRALLAEVLAHFRAAGLENARTMVEWSDGGDLSFYVAMGFERGPFIELEKRLSL